jgi:hypothetical protein
VDQGTTQRTLGATAVGASGCRSKTPTSGRPTRRRWRLAGRRGGGRRLGPGSGGGISPATGRAEAGASREVGAGAEGGRRGASAGPYPARVGGWGRVWAAGLASRGGGGTVSGGGRRWGRKEARWIRWRGFDLGRTSRIGRCKNSCEEAL